METVHTQKQYFFFLWVRKVNFERGQSQHRWPEEIEEYFQWIM